MEIMGNLQEESGELAQEINRRFGNKPRKEGGEKGNIGQEIVDTIFPLVCLANSLNIDLEANWQKMVQERLYKRDKDRFEKKEQFTYFEILGKVCILLGNS